MGPASHAGFEDGARRRLVGLADQRIQPRTPVRLGHSPETPLQDRHQRGMPSAPRHGQQQAITQGTGEG